MKDGRQAQKLCMYPQRVKAKYGVKGKVGENNLLQL